MGECPLCNTTHGKKWSKDLISGKIKALDAAIEFKMSLEDVNDHIQNHNLPDTDIVKFSELMDDPEFIFERLGKILVQTETWMDFTIETDEMDPRNIDRGIKLVKEIRETLKLIAELKGKLNRGDKYYNQFIQIQGNYNQFTTQVLESVCPSCQMKLIESIGNIKTIPTPKE